MSDLRIEKKFPTFPDHTIPDGLLPRDKGAQACWWVYILCQKQKELVGKGPESQIIVEDIHDPQSTQWMDHHYLQTGRSLAWLYDLSLEEIFRYWPAVSGEAERVGLPQPDPAYMNPRRFMI